jgi:predicted N-acyltransferase
VQPSRKGRFMGDIDYVTRVAQSPLEVDAHAWDALLDAHPDATPFMRHA